jgi:hypothetical protein
VENLGTVEEFERKLRSEAEEVVRQNTMAAEATARAHAQPGEHFVNPVVYRIETITDGDIVTTIAWMIEPGNDASPMNRGVYSVFYEKTYYNNHRPGIIGVISNGNGFWQWLSANNHCSSYGNNTYPQFRFNGTILSSGHLDNSRTRHATFSGMYYATSSSPGVTATRYEEFAAGSAAQQNNL